MNKPPRGEELKRLNAHLNLLKVSAQDIPNMTVKVGPGNFWMNGNSFIEFAGGNSTIIAKPTQGSKYVCIVINKYAQLVVVEGTTSTTLAIEPTLPIINKDTLPLAIIYIKSTTTIITNDMVYDARPLFNWGTFKLNHSDLDFKNIAGSHTIDAITGLREELDGKPKDIEIEEGPRGVTNQGMIKAMKIAGTDENKLKQLYIAYPEIFISSIKYMPRKLCNITEKICGKN